MNDTTQRTIELMHIYNQMIKTPFDQQNTFLANLNSFLALARSMTNVMQKEFSHVSGFDEWYSTKQEEMKKDADMKFFKKMRNKSLKEKSVGRVTVELKLLDDVTLKPGEELLGPALKCTNEGTLVLDKDNSVFKINGTPRPDIKFEFIVNYYFVEKPNVSAK